MVSPKTDRNVATAFFSLLLVLTITSSDAIVIAWDSEHRNSDAIRIFLPFAKSRYGLALDGSLGTGDVPSGDIARDGSVTGFRHLDFRAILSPAFIRGKIQVASLQAGESDIILGSSSLGIGSIQPGSTGLGFDNENQ